MSPLVSGLIVWTKLLTGNRTYLIVIRSRSGAKAAALKSLIVLPDPAFKLMVTEGGLLTGTVQLVPVQETVFAVPPFTLTEKFRLPFTRQ